MNVEVYLEFPENMIGVARIMSVISYDSNGDKIHDYQELVDNADFFCEDNDYRLEIKQYISSRVDIDENIIKFMN